MRSTANSYSAIPRIVWGCLIILLWFSPAWSGWNVPVDTPTQVVQWPETLKLSIPQPNSREEILFPQQTSEFCVVSIHAYNSDQAELWSLITGKKVHQIKGKPPQCIKRALSADGRWMALNLLDKSNHCMIEIWSFETGLLQSKFDAAPTGMSMVLMEFIPGHDELVTYCHGQVGAQFVREFHVWDVKTGQVVRKLTPPNGLQKCDISPTGKWIACKDSSDVAIIDLQSGEELGRIETASKTEDGEYVNLDEFRISPDGTEIACVLTGQKSWVIEVHKVSDGSRDFSLTIPLSNINQLTHVASYKGPKLDYVQKPAGFLLGGGGFIDRETGLMPWNYVPGVLEFSHWKRFLIPAGLIVSTGESQSRKIEVVPFPSEQLDKSLNAYRDDVPAIVKPGAKVKVVVKVDKIRFGTVEGTKASLEEALIERLAEDGLEVAEEAETLMNVKYSEISGKQLQEFVGGNPIFGGGTATGRTVQSTAGLIEIEWASKDGKTKIYSERVVLDPSTLLIRQGEDLSEANIRAKVFDVVKARLAGLPLPYFVPEDKSIANLPIATSTTAKPLSKEDALKKKIEDKKTQVRRRR